MLALFLQILAPPMPRIMRCPVHVASRHGLARLVSPRLPAMAGVTQRLQVALVERCAAIGNGQDVIHVHRRHGQPTARAQAAQRRLPQDMGTQLAPGGCIVRPGCHYIALSANALSLFLLVPPAARGDSWRIGFVLHVCVVKSPCRIPRTGTGVHDLAGAYPPTRGACRFPCVKRPAVRTGH